MEAVIQFPDILGLLTQGERCNLGVIQAAVGLRPRAIRAGKPFEVIVLLQNCSEAPIDVALELHLPAHDLKKQRGQFSTRSSRSVVRLRGAEVGWVTLPASVLAGASPGDGYQLAVDVSVRPLDKGRRIRAEQSEPATLADVPPSAVNAALALSTLTFSTARKIGRGSIDVHFSVLPSGIGALTTTSPGFTSLWTLATARDPRPLLTVFGDDLLLHTFPAVRRANSFAPLEQATLRHFADAGFDLLEPELVLITKVLALVLEFAAPSDSGHAFLQAGRLAVAPLLVNNPMNLESAPDLPRWVSELLRRMDAKPALARSPMDLLTGDLYGCLIDDAARFGYALVERETGDDFGTEAEQAAASRSLADQLDGAPGFAPLDFAPVYFPLVVTGVLINERIPAPGHTAADLLTSLTTIVQRRSTQLSYDMEPLAELTLSLIERTGYKYGYRTGA